MKRVLSIAGSDSGAGAGIQADLKTFAALGVFGTTAITAVTAQNTCGVLGYVELAPEFVAQQIEAVLTDIGADAVKTGMVASEGIIRAIADQLRRHDVRQLVVDPVMVAASGDPLLAPDAQTALVEVLFPLARVVTPNLPEVRVILGRDVDSVEAMREAAREIHSRWGCAALVKGGHLAQAAVDILYDGEAFHELRAPRIATRNIHGTGCTFSAAIAAGLAEGRPLPQAVSRAKEYITGALRHAFPVGAGHGPVHHFHDLYRRAGMVATDTGGSAGLGSADAGGCSR